MALIQIKHRYNSSVLFEVEAGTIKIALGIAISRGANLRGANLRGANLRDADLRNANLWDADLRDADLRDADLWNADLWNADLWNADLRGANLRDADLRNANLWGADLWNANLWGADLWNANLWGAKNVPIILLGLAYPVYITAENIRIGCEIHTPEEWENFTDKEIRNMDLGATEFWSVHRNMILNMAVHYADNIAENQEETAA